MARKMQNMHADDMKNDLRRCRVIHTLLGETRLPSHIENKNFVIAISQSDTELEYGLLEQTVNFLFKLFE